MRQVDPPRAAELLFASLEQNTLRTSGSGYVVEFQAMEIACTDCVDMLNPMGKKLIISLGVLSMALYLAGVAALWCWQPVALWCPDAG